MHAGKMYRLIVACPFVVDVVVAVAVIASACSALVYADLCNEI